MNELKYKHQVMNLMKGRGFSVQAHEDSISNYIPDLSFGFNGIDGWVELKYADKLPKSLNAIHHYTHGQQDWLTQRGKRGSGHCYLLVGTPHYHYLWRWDVLKDIRLMPWESAATLAVSVDDIGDLIRRLASVLKRWGGY